MDRRAPLLLISAFCFVGVALSQTTPTPAALTTTLLENGTAVTPTPVPVSTSTTSSCSAFNTSTCEPCAPGSQYDNGTLLCSCCPQPGLCLFPGACLPCTIGFYQPLSGQQQCLPCRQGFYTNFTGSPVCLPCPAGSFNNNTGADRCASCSPGFFSSLHSSTSCSPCAQGSFCNVRSVLEGQRRYSLQLGFAHRVGQGCTRLRTRLCVRYVAADPSRFTGAKRTVMSAQKIIIAQSVFNTEPLTTAFHNHFHNPTRSNTRARILHVGRYWKYSQQHGQNLDPMTDW
uniref:sushi, von Willebrand factor type A, EGF and pentraxin domain-containing protein 1 isoform X2 n=1 Tax=Doryrhamphus excisus TaxID=161450 RepID=UPI0025AD9D13|nr:sushi, von Willebrand factor type A, EGF and pentraxin domain-containing protein 1 isoform X2 [Doryrhamphus excisus]